MGHRGGWSAEWEHFFLDFGPVAGRRQEYPLGFRVRRLAAAAANSRFRLGSAALRRRLRGAVEIFGPRPYDRGYHFSVQNNVLPWAPATSLRYDGDFRNTGLRPVEAVGIRASQVIRQAGRRSLNLIGAPGRRTRGHRWAGGIPSGLQEEEGKSSPEGRDQGTAAVLNPPMRLRVEGGAGSPVPRGWGLDWLARDQGVRDDGAERGAGGGPGRPGHG